MDPLTMMMMSFAPTLMSGYLQRNDPNAKNRRMMQAKLNSPQLSPDYFYKQWQNSQAASSGMNAILQGANMAQGNLQAQTARAGGESTGVGQAGMANVHAMPGVAMANLNAQAWLDAVQRAMNHRQQVLQESQILGNAPQTPNYFAELLGAGIESMSPYLAELAKKGGTKPNPNALSPSRVAGGIPRQDFQGQMIGPRRRPMYAKPMRF